MSERVIRGFYLRLIEIFCNAHLSHKVILRKTDSASASKLRLRRPRLYSELVVYFCSARWYNFTPPFIHKKADLFLERLLLSYSFFQKEGINKHNITIISSLPSIINKLRKIFAGVEKNA